MVPPPPSSTLFPYTTLFRSQVDLDDLRLCGLDVADLVDRGVADGRGGGNLRSEEHTSELQSHSDLVCRLLLEKKKISVKRAGHSTEHAARSHVIIATCWRHR